MKIVKKNKITYNLYFIFNDMLAFRICIYTQRY